MRITFTFSAAQENLKCTLVRLFRGIRDMCKNYYFLYATDICHVQKMHPSANTRITMKTYIEKVYTNKQLNQIYVFTIKNEYALYYVIEGGKKDIVGWYEIGI